MLKQMWDTKTNQVNSDVISEA